MSTIYYDVDAHLSPPTHPHTQSLIERKKQQWAREREELAGLNENVPWGTRDSLQLYDRPNIKTRYVTKYQKESEYLRRDSTYSTSSSATVPGTPRRRQHSAASVGGSQQLPPLYKNQHFTYTPDEKSDKEMGGETSGYGSDNAHHTPEHLPRAGGDLLRHHQQQQQQQQHFHHNRQQQVAAHHATTNANNGYESSSSGREDRLKWGDRGVHLGRYWEPPPKDNMAEAPSGAPGWVKRGLERETELVVVNNSSPAESPEQDYGERPETSSSSMTNRCFIRGQNVPIDTAELAERERRRQVALAHQDAIREQLEEREKRRQEERARRLREEYEEERRIAREQEIERQRQQEQELQRIAKEERERKRKEALREAIEIAEKEAKEEKLKQRLMRQNNQLNYVENNNEKHEKTIDKDIKTRKNLNNERQQLIQEKEDLSKEKQEQSQSQNLIAKTVNNNSNNNEKKEHEIEDRQLVIHNREKTLSTSDSDSAPSESNLSQLAMSNVNNVSFPNLTSENIAVLLQNPLTESLQMQNVQFVLIPTLNSSLISSSSVQTVQTVQTQIGGSSTTRTENRLLTPTQYRNKRQTCDSATQTDLPDYRRELCDKLANIEICYETRSRKERRERSRSEMRHGELESQERPKWGVNRPPTRYLKQSEKDPLYQRRKMRQKLRQSKTYDDKRYSSDDSQADSPRTYRRRRGFWRKEDALYAENIKVYQTEIIPLESDKDHIYFRTKATNQHQCCCKCVGTGDSLRYATNHTHSDRVDIMKIETPTKDREYKDRDKLPVCNNNNGNNNNMDEDGILDKLTSIHNDLMLKDNWEERSVLYSPSRHP